MSSLAIESSPNVNLNLNLNLNTAPEHYLNTAPRLNCGTLATSRKSCSVLKPSPPTPNLNLNLNLYLNMNMNLNFGPGEEAGEGGAHDYDSVNNAGEAERRVPTIAKGDCRSIGR